MDRKNLLAMTLCFLIFVGWQKFVIEPRMQPLDAQTSVTAPAQSPAQAQQQPVTSTAAVAANKAANTDTQALQTIEMDTGTGHATLSNSGSIFSSWSLSKYKTGISPTAPAVDLENVTSRAAEVTLAFDDPTFAYLPEARGKMSADSQVHNVTWTYEDSNIKASRNIFSSHEQPYVDITLNAEFKGKHPKYAFIYLTSQGHEKDPEAQDRQLVYFTNQSAERITLAESISQKEIVTPVKYIATTTRYFLMSIIDKSGASPSALIQPAGTFAGRISLVYPINSNSISIPVRVYFGPKELDLIRKVEPTLDHTVEFGWFTIFAYPLLKVLNWFYQFAQNYGLAIIFLTLLLKVVTYPLTYKSMKSMKKMAKLQPQLQKLRDRYKDDREALNREMLTMMKKNGYNPMAGCLPMLIQMPVFFALYRVLYSSIELYHAPFALWIYDLSSHDPYYVTPVLLSLTMFIQQKLTPNTATDPMQAKMMQFMPIIFGAFMLNLPSGLTLYMLVNAIAGIAQQIVLNKKFETSPA